MTKGAGTIRAFYVSVDSRSLPAQTLFESPFLKGHARFGSVICIAHLRGRPALADKKVLLIDRCQATREARAAVLRSHGVEVHEAETLSTARFL